MASETNFDVQAEFRALTERSLQQAKQAFEAAQSARPVTRVGGGGGTAGRRTTDASGDALSAEEWIKRERERVRKR